MSISVSELFLLDEFSDAKILAGSDGLEKNVYYVSILSSRENLQSTKAHDFAIIYDRALLSDEKFLYDLIAHCSYLKISCIGICCAHEEDVPSWLINQADQIKTPLILFPDINSLSKIVNVCIGHVINTQMLQLQTVLNSTYMFIDIAKRGGDITELANALSRSINLPVLIENEKYELLSFANDQEHFNPNISDMDILSMNRAIKKHLYEPALSESLQSIYHFTGIKNPLISFIVVPILYANRNLGNITVVSSLNYPVNEILLKNAAAYTALSMAAIKSRLDKERLIRDDILISLLHNRRDTIIEDVSYWLSELHLSDNAPYIVFMISPDVPNDSELSESFQQVATSYIRDAYFFKEEGKLLFIRSFRNQKDSEISRFFIDLKEMFLKRAHGISFQISISNLCEDINNLNDAYQQALTALDICKKILPPNSLGYYSNMDLFCLFNEQHNKELLIRFSSHYLSNLINNTSMSFDAIGTLQAYLDNGQSIGKTSQVLYLHRNTLKYRIRRLKEILNESFDNQEYTTKLTLAIIIYRLFPYAIEALVSSDESATYDN